MQRERETDRQIDRHRETDSGTHTDRVGVGGGGWRRWGVKWVTAIRYNVYDDKPSHKQRNREDNLGLACLLIPVYCTPNCAAIKTRGDSHPDCLWVAQALGTTRSAAWQMSVHVEAWIQVDIYIYTEKQGSLWLLCTAPCRKDLVWCNAENV